MGGGSGEVLAVCISPVSTTMPLMRTKTPTTAPAMRFCIALNYSKQLLLGMIRVYYIYG